MMTNYTALCCDPIDLNVDDRRWRPRFGHPLTNKQKLSFHRIEPKPLNPSSKLDHRCHGSIAARDDRSRIARSEERTGAGESLVARDTRPPYWPDRLGDDFSRTASLASVGDLSPLAVPARCLAGTSAIQDSQVTVEWIPEGGS